MVLFTTGIEHLPFWMGPIRINEKHEGCDRTNPLEIALSRYK